MTTPDEHTRAARLAAFEGLVAAYEAPLLRYAGRILRDANAAQDVVQDAFLRLFRLWTAPLEPGPVLSAWLYRVTHNSAVDHLRREARRRLLHLRHAEEQPQDRPPDLGAGARVSDEALAAARALRQLSLREQQVVILKVYEEKSYREIGAITGLSESNVGFILHHAMRKMAAALNPKSDGGGGAATS